MPTRLIREGILTSEAVNSLPPLAELFYRRLMSVVDDHGRFVRHLQRLRSACYPLQVDAVTAADVDHWLTDCERAGLLRCYEVDGRHFLQVERFDQRTRAASKFPAPPSDDSEVVGAVGAEPRNVTVQHAGNVAETALRATVLICPTNDRQMTSLDGGGDGGVCEDGGGDDTHCGAFPARERVGEGACARDARGLALELDFGEPPPSPAEPPGIGGAAPPPPPEQPVLTDRGYAEVSRALRQARVADAHPGFMPLRLAVDVGGVTLAEWSEAGRMAAGKGKGAAYAVGIVRGWQRDRAQWVQQHDGCAAGAVASGGVRSPGRSEPAWVARKRRTAWAMDVLTGKLPARGEHAEGVPA